MKKILGIGLVAVFASTGLMAADEEKGTQEKQPSTTETTPATNRDAEGKGQEAKKPYEVRDQDVTAISFRKGSTDLTEKEKTSLQDLMKKVDADKSVEVEKVIVASWADEKYPTGDKNKLSEEARDLADKRGDKIKKVLEDARTNKDMDVEVYSMASEPNWIQKTFNMDEAELKESVSGKADTTEYRKVADMLERKGGPSKAVVIVKRKMEEATSH